MPLATNIIRLDDFRREPSRADDERLLTLLDRLDPQRTRFIFDGDFPSPDEIHPVPGFLTEPRPTRIVVTHRVDWMAVVAILALSAGVVSAALQIGGAL